VELIRDKVDFTFKSLGESPLAAQQDRVAKFIRAKKLCSAKEVYARNAQHMTYVQFEQILYILEMAGQIRKRTVGKVQMYEPI
jgi:lipase chaperone LimK